MKIGIISDVHSNIDALIAVFNKFQEENINQIVCLGDVIGIGPYPQKCIQYLMDRNDMINAFVKGNHENYLLKGIPKRNHNEKNAKPLSEEEIATHTWNHRQLQPKQVEFISKLKNRDVLEIENKKIVLEHYPMDNKDKFKKFYKIPTLEQICENFENKNADIYLFGHTHTQIYYENNNKYFINPGSLGCPINTNCACAGILEIKNNNIKYEQLEIKYDIHKVINDIKTIKYPLNNFMIKCFYGEY